MINDELGYDTERSSVVLTMELLNQVKNSIRTFRPSKSLSMLNSQANEQDSHAHVTGNHKLNKFIACEKIET